MAKSFRLLTEKIDIKFKTLSAEESDRYVYALKTFPNKHDIEEAIFLKVTDYNESDISELDAGIIPTIAYLSLKLSGYLRTDFCLVDKIDKAREDIKNNPYNKIYSIIVATQPHYTLESLRKKTLNEVLELFAFSELIVEREAIDTKEIRANIKAAQNERKATVSATKKSGISNVTKEEIDLVKQMLNASEFNPEMI